MVESQDIIKQAAEVLRLEAEGILGLIDRIDNRFHEMIRLIVNSSGRLVIAGIGKSGIVGQKIVATLNSTGTRSFFLHPVEAMHGDLGMVGKDDVFLAISNSGKTGELNMLVPVIKNIGCKVIAFTGDLTSILAQESDIVIDVGVKKEACPLGLAPTTSTAAQLAMGDALAVVLINEKRFKSSDFKKFHPGGSLGQRLSSRVEDIMLTESAVPAVNENAPMKSVIDEIDRLSIGVALVTTTDGKLAGIITDGDIRRTIAKNQSVFDKTAGEFMTIDPQTLGPASPAYDALNVMEKHQITVLPIVDASKSVKGILHLHDILGKGEFKFNGKIT
ncbi:KpsF/GutQ family sugar-phosphate isomerase [Desulfobacterales bacterium HSG16]|nr:KpsF/GutQ family sugar-phosphate isomerase [Desulfobacterales bacterium HSG16]